MNKKVRLSVTAVVSVAIWLLLAWNYFNGGIPSHHLLARKDLPEISNIWGGVLLPLLTWFLLYRIQIRTDQSGSAYSLLKVIYGFICALLIGLSIALLFSYNVAEIPGYILLGIIASGLFIPIYRSEYILGFVLGMTYTFGGVLPVIVSAVLISIGAIEYLVIRQLVIKIISKF